MCFVLTDMLRGFTIALPGAKQTADIIASTVIHHGSAKKESTRNSYSKSSTEALNLLYGCPSQWHSDLESLKLVRGNNRLSKSFATLRVIVTVKNL